MTAYNQIDESQRTTSLRPIGIIAMEPDSLTTRYGLTFHADEHDGTTAAMMVLDTGKQYMLLRHLDAPVSGTEVLAAEQSPDPEGDLDHFLHALELAPEVVTWRLSHDEALASLRELSNGRERAHRTPRQPTGSRSTAKRSAAKRSAAKRSTAKRSTGERSAAERSTTKRTSSGGPARTQRSARQTGPRRSGSVADTRADDIATRLRKLNDRIIEAGKAAGESTLTSYEKFLKSVADTIERVPGSSDIEWVSNLATAQAKFIRDLTKSSTRAARKALK